MLLTALKAKLPIIACTTRDPVNAQRVIKHLIGKQKLVECKPEAGLSPNHTIYYAIGLDVANVNVALHQKLVKADNSILILVNCKPNTLAFNAGELPIPRELVFNEMSEFAETGAVAEALTTCLGGCTIKEAVELAMLTMADQGSLTPQGLLHTRRGFFQGQSGLTLVDTDQSFYEPPEALAAYVQQEKQFFLHENDVRLRPRGLMFDGEPGTGKTSGAKWLCSEWGIPLYRVDIGGTKGKYHGESEGNMLANLQRIDVEEPCGVLFDEIEKVFRKNVSGEDSVSMTMQSQLLWWLSERRSRTFVMMTTNNEKIIPDELHREGRIDKTITFEGLEHEAGIEFMVRVLNTFDIEMDIDADHLTEMFKAARPDISLPRASQAALTQQAYKFVKAIKAK
jgi:hypothetical protein